MSDVIENVTFMWCPPERLVEVEVPITVRNTLLGGTGFTGRAQYIAQSLADPRPSLLPMLLSAAVSK